MDWLVICVVLGMPVLLMLGTTILTKQELRKETAPGERPY